MINTLPSLSAKKPLLVVATVEALANEPTFIEPAEFKTTFPPVKVVVPSTQPPIDPLSACKLVASRSPCNCTAEAVI